jgi:hypothetical protein
MADIPMTIIAISSATGKMLFKKGATLVSSEGPES